MKLLAVLFAIAGIGAIGIGGPWQICAFEIDTNMEECKNISPCTDVQCYVDRWTDYFCNVNPATGVIWIRISRSQSSEIGLTVFWRPLDVRAWQRITHIRHITNGPVVRVASIR